MLLSSLPLNVPFNPLPLVSTARVALGSLNLYSSIFAAFATGVKMNNRDTPIISFFMSAPLVCQCECLRSDGVGALRAKRRFDDFARRIRSRYLAGQIHGRPA